MVKNKIPAIDFADIQDEISPLNATRRQFAPQYAQDVYATMLKKEKAIEDYTSDAPNSWMTNSVRRELITLIEELQEAQAYRIETYYLAVSIADRFISNLMCSKVTKKQSPCFVTLAVTCLLIAAKIEEPM